MGRAMRRIRSVMTFCVLCSASWAQSAQPAVQQTARQALIEMVFGKTPGTFMKHLPDVTRAALEKAGATKSIEEYSMMASKFQPRENNLQTFETGSILLSAVDPKTGNKFELDVESDSLNGDEDDIVVSFQSYESGKLKRTPYMPQLTFAMKMESGVWTLNEISVTVHLPLADPDLLKSFIDGMKARAAAAATTTQISLQPQITAQPQIATQTFGTDTSIIAAMRTILTAEVTYANTYRNVGYTCILSDLDGFGSGEPNEHQAMLINSGLAGGKKYGYIFSLSGCGTFPSKGFVLTAAPNAANYGRKTFCADQSAAIKSSPDVNPASCLSTGTSVQ